MPQPRRAKQVGKIEWRQIGRSKYAIPKSATYQTGDDSDLPYYVEITIANDGDGPTCRRLTIEQRPGGPPVTSDGLRSVPVGRIVEHFADMHIMLITDPAKGVKSGLSLLPDVNAAVEAFDAIGAEHKAGRRRITDEDLRRLAEICVRAKAKGRSYITMAELELGITRDQARQWKRKAIAGGFLPTEGEQ